MRFFLVLASVLAAGGQAGAAQIELYNPVYAPLIQPHCLTYDYFGTPSFIVALHPDGETDLVGARLRITGLPPGCNVTVTPSPFATLSDGELFSSGAEIRFASPQTGSTVELYDVTVTCPDSVLSVWATRVVLQPAAVQPAIPGFDCPVVIATGSSTPEFICAEYTSISDHPAACEIAVAPTTWGATKVLYR